jgi:hypothetical protein
MGSSASVFLLAPNRTQPTIFNCPDSSGHDPCKNIWVQSNCAVSGAVTDAAVAVPGGVATDFGNGALNSGGATGTEVLQGGVAGLKTGTVAFAGGILAYGYTIFKTAWNTVMGCS